ncbi:sensor histidine kinase [Pseudoramibacter sp.]|jgi:signal transduction histidine kinase|uniref:sensor histidine kinase n=1 Tax=Pseudoramibacter sp. TaxID=2034862 RepID=UPI0025FB96D0|nr:HAMP domain-containing sensor histidine kinase [Pseudoramibacter sp.]MCH4072695.1 HAMP domain-containing histidine kinase [Pseudoramibacter sp.]MCH4106466.1 HAMP domain-containing histidine kinase [Pseudoramibacter sp.]
MIKTLQKKFILVSTCVVALILLAVLGLINVMYMRQSNNEIQEVLKYISQNHGELPSNINLKNTTMNRLQLNDESPSQIRYFSVFIDSHDMPVHYDLSHITSIHRASAKKMVRKILAFEKNYQWIKGSPFQRLKRLQQNHLSFAYYISKPDSSGQRMIIFMDTSYFDNSNHEIFNFSATFGLFCLLAFFIIVSLFSKRVLHPIIENTEKQKRFITNAGHELKTPLSIISANTEVTEALNGKNEWTQSTLNQVKRLNDLVNSLMTISRLEEQQNLQISTVDLSQVTLKIAKEYRSTAIKKGLTLSTTIKEHVKVKAEEKTLEELLNILLDNAVKYCDPGGIITVNVDSKGFSNKYLSVSNTYQNGDKIDTSKLFERFYRGDTSHNNKISGSGIGLSMAKGISDFYNTQIKANWHDGIMTIMVSNFKS